MKRRTFLTSLGAATTASLVGCLTDQTGTETPTATSTQRTKTTDQTTTVNVPDRYQVHFVPGKNQELRSDIPGRQLQQYIQDFGADTITDANILSTTPEHGYQEKQIDLLAMEYWHDNGVQNIETEEGQAFLKTIGEDSTEGSRAHKAKNSPKATLYPNFNRETEDFGHFKYEELQNAGSVDEALDWLQRYLFNWQRNWDDPGPISTEDELYAAVLQEGLDQHTDIESHAWAFDLPEASGSTHGNGLIYDETNNQLHLMETISGPTTQTPGESDEQYHPPVEESNYLEEDHEAKQSWWHPLRFAQEHDKETPTNFSNELDFRSRKNYAGSLLILMSTGFDEDMTSETDDVKAGIAPTTGYLADVTGKLLNWNQDDSLDAEMFEEIKNQSKVYNLLRNHEDNFVMYGTVEDPKAAYVESEEVINEVWNDQEREYDDFDQYLEPAA